MIALLAVALQVGVQPIDVSLTVDGVERRAVVFRAADTQKAAPVVFVWHGFTGNARQAAFSYHLHQSWPEATVIYPQGLEVELLNRKAPGWQIAPKTQGDRDVKFFDALLAKAKSDYRADAKRIYTCGMSNGAIFSYVLLDERASVFAAAAPVAGFATPAFKGIASTPILIIHGKADPLLAIKMAEDSRDIAIANNKAVKSVTEWQPGYVLYSGPKGHDVVWHEHEGGHMWPKDATDSIVRFFKAHARP
jgi:polyhydroxybutyrate depolymerase